MKGSAEPPIKFRHGKIYKLQSRGQFCVEGVNKNCSLQDWNVNGLESGKFFPATRGGLADPLAKDDVYNIAPPPDKKIASAGQSHAAVLDEAGAKRWHKHPVKSGQEIELEWSYSAKHATRRWNYFITQENWDPEQPLARNQFEAKPFYKVELTYQPYWNHEPELLPKDPTIHKFKLPNRKGYHVILGVWEIANGGNAFYQVIDVEFE